MLLKCFLRLFPDSTEVAKYHFYLQMEHWQIFLSIHFALQRSCSKVLRGLNSLLPNFLHHFSYRFGKWLFHWCYKWFLIEVFEHIFWLALPLRPLLINHFWLLLLPACYLCKLIHICKFIFSLS